MARKPKRMALYEAIRQGQAKIADGLKTGQMRGDWPHQKKKGPKVKEYETEAVTQKPHIGDMSALLRSKEKRLMPVLSSKTVMILLGCTLQLLILGLGIWIGILYYGNKGEVSQVPAPKTDFTPSNKVIDEPPVDSGSGPVQVPQNPPPQRPIEPKDKQEPVIEKVEKQTTISSAPTGSNVIVIQGITAGRKDELNVLKEYFDKKGIPTEVIMNRSGYAILVTKAGFDKSPQIPGTEGYKLLEKVRDLGESYVRETEDTKFGSKPFQDAYGYKK